MGRPRKEIDKDLFIKLCSIGCTKEEIADMFSVSEMTLTNWCKREFKDSFFNTYKKYSAHMKISLRRYQFKLAQTSASMAIWLGKQYLGQTDQPAENIDAEDFEAYFSAGGVPMESCADAVEY